MAEVNDAMQSVLNGAATYDEAEVLSFEVSYLRARVSDLEAELHARNVEAKRATIQAVGFRKQMADAVDVLSAR